MVGSILVLAPCCVLAQAFSCDLCLHHSNENNALHRDNGNLQSARDATELAREDGRDAPASSVVETLVSDAALPF